MKHITILCVLFLCTAMLLLGCEKSDASHNAFPDNDSAAVNQSLQNEGKNDKQEAADDIPAVPVNLPLSINPEHNPNAFAGPASYFTADCGMVLASVAKDGTEYYYVCFTHDGGKSWDRPQQYDRYDYQLSKGISRDIYWDFSNNEEMMASIGNDTWKYDPRKESWTKVDISDVSQDAYRPDGTHTGITEDDILRKYKPENVLSTRLFQDTYLLVESRSSPAVMYELYDLKTGHMDILDIRPYFAEPEAFISPNNIVFYSDGEIQFSPIHNFPLSITFMRGDENSEFIRKDSPRYFGLQDSLTFGDAGYAVISDIVVTQNGLEIKFEPDPSSDYGFSIADGRIPVTSVRYSEDTGQITFRFNKTIMAEKYRQNGMNISQGNDYFSSIQLAEDVDFGSIVVNLKPEAKKYAADVNDRLVITFSGDIV